MNYTITRNTDFNSIEITFDGKPSEEVRAALKALRFRWHGQKKVWYGYATEDAARAAIEGQSSEEASTAPKSTPKAGKVTKATQKAKGTEQNHIRIYWNGIKIDGGKLIRCFYSLDNNAEHAPSVSISARDYSDLPRDLLPVQNDSDSYTDYFEHDHAYITQEHPLYRYFRFAGARAKIRDLKSSIEYNEKELAGRERWPGRYEYVKQELERNKARLTELESMEDPGQPTAEDLAEIDRQKQEAENARKAAEHEEELRQREIYLAQRVNGQRLIKSESEAHPVRENAPAVLIHWSEHPAFSDYADDSLILSITAAENILRRLDEEQHETRETENGRGWYYKTKFTITGKDESGEAFNYSGRYDLGDGDGGLVQHIRNFGEWCRTHDGCGHDIAQPEETNETIQFADYLAGCLEA